MSRQVDFMETAPTRVACCRGEGALEQADKGVKRFHHAVINLQGAHSDSTRN